MKHWKNLLPPSEYIGPQDFEKGPMQLAIVKVVRQKLTERDDEQGCVMYLEYNGKPCKKRYNVPKSVVYGLHLELGPDVEKWAGSDVELYPAHCFAFGQVEECVRIRFKDSTDRAIKAWLKKKKVNPKVYMCDAGGQ